MTVWYLKYTNNTEFMAFLSVWQRDRSCPFPLADWLRERDLPGEASGADWAAIYRRRCCPRLTPAGSWHWHEGLARQNDPAALPVPVFKALACDQFERLILGYASYSTFADAACTFLGAWAVHSHKYRPRRKPVLT